MGIRSMYGVRQRQRWELNRSGAWRGGHLDLKRYPTEAVNAKIQGRSTPFGAKKGGGQLQTKSKIGVLTYNSLLYSLYSIRYMAFFI